MANTVLMYVIKSNQTLFCNRFGKLARESPVEVRINCILDVGT